MTTPAERRLAELRRLRALKLAEQQAQADEAVKQLAFSDYRTKARPQQLPPEGDWRIWLILAGRGFGKTWTGSKWLLEKALQQPETEWAVVARPSVTCAVSASRARVASSRAHSLDKSSSTTSPTAR